MDYATYRNRYEAAYEKLAGKVNVMDGGYSDDELREAYRIYTVRGEWYFRAFKPSALASTNVLFYEYQIRGALEWKGISLEGDDLLKEVHDNPEEICEICREWARRTQMKTTA